MDFDCRVLPRQWPGEISLPPGLRCPCQLAALNFVSYYPVTLPDHSFRAPPWRCQLSLCQSVHRAEFPSLFLTPPLMLHRCFVSCHPASRCVKQKFPSLFLITSLRLHRAISVATLESEHGCCSGDRADDRRGGKPYCGGWSWTGNW